MTSASLPGVVRGRRSARRLVRWVVASSWLLVTLGALAGVGVLLVLNRGDAEGSSRIANAEIEALLSREERVEHRVPVTQRHWWDWFRVTHGVLAATNRRLLYIGVPPERLVAREFEPLELVELSYPYERAVLVERPRVFLGTSAGLRLTANGGASEFGVSSRDRGRVDSVVAVLARRQQALRAAADAERRATEATMAASRRAIYHLVQRGEAIDGIARRYGVPPDSIMTWNALTSPRITAGRRLLVKPETP